MRRIWRSEVATVSQLLLVVAMMTANLTVIRYVTISSAIGGAVCAAFLTAHILLFSSAPDMVGIILALGMLFLSLLALWPEFKRPVD